ncbi:MAG: acyl--CoA ligase [Lachnospiraceae bacterium]|nr:acyl--CoA ligase [Lachnospiraceae bacterium]
MKGTVEENRQALDRLYPRWIPATIWERFLYIADRYPKNEFVIFDHDVFTYEDVRRESLRYAKALMSLGVRAGDHVALLLTNCPEFVFLTFAAAAIGAVKIPVNPAIGRIQLHSILSRSDAQYIVLRERLSLDPDAVPNLKSFIWIGEKLPFEDAVKTVCSVDILREAEELPDDDIYKYAKEHGDPFSMCDILFTSGSTSEPKGVIELHDMIMRDSFATAYTRCYEIGRRVFLPVPLYHVMAYVGGLMTCMIAAGTAVFLTKKFDVSYAVSVMKEKRINDMQCMPITIQKLLNDGNLKPGDLPDMHAAYWTNCPTWIWKKGMEVLGVTDLSNGYGMSECASSVTMVSPEDMVGSAAHCNGRKKLGGITETDPEYGAAMEIRICDFDTGKVLGTGKQGEIQYRGPQTTPGYYKNPEVTAASFTEDGWFRSNDIGMIDHNGYLYFSGRYGDVYKINGENVSPQFLDRVIADCPGVVAVECVGVPDPRCNAVGAAFVDVTDPETVTEEVLRAFCKEHLAKFQIPQYFFFSDSKTWPRTASNKIKKAGLRELAAELIASKA